MAAQPVESMHDSPKVCGAGDSPEWLHSLWSLCMILPRYMGMEILLNGCEDC